MRIYLIRHKISGKGYVGQTSKSLRARVAGHRSASKTGDTLLNKAIRKHGWDTFEVEVLEECEDGADLDMAERFWIKTLGTLAPGGYNLETGGHLHKRASEATKRKLSEMRKGKVFDADYRRALSIAATNKSPEWLEGISRANRGEGNGQAILTWNKVRQIRSLADQGFLHREIGEAFGISRATVGDIANRKTWRESRAFPLASPLGSQ